MAKKKKPSPPMATEDAFRLVLLYELMNPRVTHGRSEANATKEEPLVSEGDLKIGILETLGITNTDSQLDTIANSDFTSLFNRTLADCKNHGWINSIVYSSRQTVHEITADGKKELATYGAKHTIDPDITKQANLAYEPSTTLSKKVIQLETPEQAHTTSRIVRKIIDTGKVIPVPETILAAHKADQTVSPIGDSKDNINPVAQEELRMISEAIRVQKQQRSNNSGRSAD